MADSIEAQMSELLDQYSREVQDVVDESTKTSAKEAAKKLRQSSPTGPNGYAKGWTSKKIDGGHVTYNKDKPGLTHLLENSHIIRNKSGSYGRTSPGHGQVVHIKPVADEEVEEFEQRIRRGLSEV